jgi:hypothetical protein
MTIAIALTLAATTTAARAQTAGCRGMLAGTMRLGIADAAGTVTTLPDAEAQHFFGAAECGCQESRLRVHIELTQVLPPSTTGTVELWQGSGCADVAIRTEEDSPCRKLAVASIQDFTTLGSGVVDLPLSSGVCRTEQIDLVLVAYADPQLPLATCELPLTAAKMARAAAPTTVGATRGDDGIIVFSWTPNPASTTAPAAYQLLCADADGARLVDPPQPDTTYSVCLPNRVLERRTLGLDGDGVLGGGNFAALDHGFVCSPPLAADSTSYALMGVGRDRDVQLAIVAVDAWGNAVAGPTVMLSAVPRGGCDVVGAPTRPIAATAAWWAVGCVVLILLACRRRRA